MLDQLFAAVERDRVAAIPRKQEPAVGGLKGGNIVLDETAQPHHVYGVGAEDVLRMVADGDVKKYTGQEDNNENAGGSAGEEFEMEMLLAEKPRETSPKEAEACAFWLNFIQRFLGLAHYNY